MLSKSHAYFQAQISALEVSINYSHNLLRETAHHVEIKRLGSPKQPRAFAKRKSPTTHCQAKPTSYRVILQNKTAE